MRCFYVSLERRPNLSKSKIKALYYDIENSRMVVKFPTYVLWDIKRIDPKYILKDWHITSVSWAYLDIEKQKIGKVHSVSLLDFPSRFKKDPRDDYEVVKKFHQVLSDPDLKLIVGHNSQAFDIKKLNTKFSIYGLDPIDFPAHVDTIKANKKYRKSSSNSLAHLCREFDVTKKIDLPSSVMWAADDGCEKSLRKLVKYNKGDIISGASVYFKLLPYIKNHPDMRRLADPTKTAAKAKTLSECGTCNSDNTYSLGLRADMQGPYRRIKCRSCGATTKQRLTKEELEKCRKR